MNYQPQTMMIAISLPKVSPLPGWPEKANRQRFQERAGQRLLFVLEKSRAARIDFLSARLPYLREETLLRFRLYRAGHLWEEFPADSAGCILLSD